MVIVSLSEHEGALDQQAVLQNLGTLEIQSLFPSGFTVGERRKEGTLEILTDGGSQ